MATDRKHLSRSMKKKSLEHPSELQEDSMKAKGGDVEAKGGDVKAKGGDVKAKGGDVKAKGGDVCCIQ
jgi:hypothetical protein